MTRLRGLPHLRRTCLKDAQRLVELVRQTGLKFLVGQTMRFDRQPSPGVEDGAKSVAVGVAA